MLKRVHELRRGIRLWPRPVSGLDLCAKSGTAEIGDGTTHAWFVRYLRTGAPVALR